MHISEFWNNQVANLTPHALNIETEFGQCNLQPRILGGLRAGTKVERLPFPLHAFVVSRPAEPDGNIEPATPEAAGIRPLLDNPGDLGAVSSIIVSEMTAKAIEASPPDCPWRKFIILTPNTQKDSVIRSADGQITGVKGLHLWSSNYSTDFEMAGGIGMVQGVWKS
jgi:hypothetical protein